MVIDMNMNEIVSFDKKSKKAVKNLEVWKQETERSSTTVTIWNWSSLLTILTGPPVPSQFTK